MAGAVEDDLGPEIGEHAIEFSDLPCADQAGDDAVAGAREEQRRLTDLRVLPGRGELPIAIDVAVPVQPAAEAGLGIDVREVGEIGFREPCR